MKITVKTKFPLSFELAYEHDVDKFNKLAKKELLEVEIKGIRSPRTHRRYFAMLNMAFDNQETYPDMDKLRKSMEIKAGYCQIIVLNGDTYLFPDSIAYYSLKEEDFKILCNKVRGVIMKEFDFGPEFDNELANFNF